jgi:uncharacterized protein (TIGR04255 family)
MTRQREATRSPYPLSEVALVTNFAPEASTECLRHEFFNQIRAIYLRLVPPEGQQEIPYAMDPYRFENKDGTAAVAVGLTSFGYVTSEYTHYEAFREESVRLFEIARKTFGISTLTRVGLRYTNLMRFERNKGIIPLDKLLKIGVKLPKGFPFHVNDPMLGFVVQTEGAVMNVRVEPRVRESPDREEAMFLTISHERTGQLTAVDMPKYVDTARLEARTLYKSVTPESYRKSFQGGEG